VVQEDSMMAEESQGEERPDAVCYDHVILEDDSHPVVYPARNGHAR